jgi:hypothetical protein
MTTTPVCCYVSCKLPSTVFQPDYVGRPVWSVCARHSMQQFHPRDIDVRKFRPYEQVSS